MTKTLLEMIGQIPATFWGVVCGSFFSILGVALTNRASTSRLRDQFEHEREVKTSERELALKKEIYLGAAEAMAAAMAGMNNIPNLEMPHEKVLAQYQEKSPAISKLHVVANFPLLQATLEFTGAFSRATLKAFAKRAQLLLKVNRITNLDKVIVRHANEADGFLELIKQHNINGINDQKKWEVLNGNFEFAQKQREKAIAQAAALREELSILKIEFSRECILATTELAPLLFPFLAAVRDELKIPEASNAYRESVEKILTEQRSAFDQFLGNMSELMVPTRSGSPPTSAHS